MLKPPRPTYNELVSQLKNLDYIESVASHVAFYGQQQNPQNSYSHRRPRFNSQGHGFQAQQTPGQTQNKESSSSQRRPLPAGRRRMKPAERECYKNDVCQYCGREGHVAKICWWIPQDKPNTPPQALTALTLDNDVIDTDWIADSGASNHMTGNKKLLKQMGNYYGADSIAIGDGTFLSIDGVGSASIKQKNTFTNFECFVCPCFKTKFVLLQGPRNNNLYILSGISKAYFANRLKTVTADIWHQRLGHPQSSAISGIKHQVSCPYTPEQTGTVERRHRVIRELGLTMMYHSHIRCHVGRGISIAAVSSQQILTPSEQEQGEPQTPPTLSRAADTELLSPLVAASVIDIVPQTETTPSISSVQENTPTTSVTNVLDHHTPASQRDNGEENSEATNVTLQTPVPFPSSSTEHPVEQLQIEAEHPRHSMVTRSQSGIVKPNPRYALHVSVRGVHGSSMALVQTFLQVLSTEFSMKDLGPLHHFLGIQVHSTATGLHLNQSRYAYSILERAQMVDCQPMPTPLVQRVDLTSDATPLSDPTHFRGLVGSLQYLTLTRPDLSYSVNFVSQFTQHPTMSHFKCLRRILRYLKGTIQYGLSFSADTSLFLSAFSDADWAGCPTTRLARSSTEAEYRSLAHTAAELTWLGYILDDLRIQPTRPPVLYGDNLSALHLTVNPVLHTRSKHVALDYHYVRERVAQGVLITKYIPSAYQIADIFTKSMTKARLAQFRRKLCLFPGHSLRGDISSGSHKDDLPSPES
ncbi:hypothetical protein K2173_007207 [Erythroxylum novogranatense]|uniref:CCHC-type domain-containing protein n=1 Tax=Erythroxylum novogranatense TaxID=1862640 RepID=A0AAV8T005_9ROSI|nr:hypothetical protein K2173_007207 [Erythroxylum novogranatense]